MPCSVLGCVCGRLIFPQRFMMVFLSALGIIVAFGQRVNLSLIITVMAKAENRSGNDCPLPADYKPEKEPDQYAWSQWQQQILLGAFFVGYLLNHVPGGYLADKYGARLVFSTAILCSSILTLLTPPAVLYTHYWVFVFIRFCIGLAQAPVFPPTTTLMARWIPKHERATVGGVTFAANSFGLIFGILFTGAMQEFFGTWVSIFYFWGLVGVLWYVFCMVYLYSEPASHPHISQKEAELLEREVIKKKTALKPDWAAIMKDASVWALIAGQFGHAWMIFFLSTNMPKYFKDVLHINIRKNTLISSLPYILQWVASVASGKLGDWMIKKRGYRVITIRVSYTTVASVFPSLCMVIIPYCGCNAILVTILMCLSLLTMGPFYCGLKVNVIDLTINFSGILMAVVNGLGAIAGFTSPYLIGWLAPENRLGQWKVVMWIMFAAASITNIIYIIWGKATRCKWDMSAEEWEVYKGQLDADIAEKKAKKEQKKAEKEAKRQEGEKS